MNTNQITAIVPASPYILAEETKRSVVCGWPQIIAALRIAGEIRYCEEVESITANENGITYTVAKRG
jgi:hypothetical protein